MVGQVLLEPSYHRRSRFAASPHVRAHRVQRDDVPGAPVVGVVALPPIASRSTKVVEVARRPGGAILVVTDRRLGTRLVVSPSRVIAVVELPEGALLVSVVSGGEYRARDRVEQIGRGRITRAVAAGDVSRSDQGYRRRLPRAGLCGKYGRRGR